VSWIVGVAIWTVAAMIVLEAWSIAVFGVLTTPEGLQFLSRVAAIVVILLIAVVIWELGDGMISRTIARGAEHAISARMRTLLPLLRNVLLVTVVVIAVITIMSEAGLDIAPLLAGAGIVGLAIGFGAQALVKDIITGAFMLFEDQFSIGDWIDAGGKSGGVESITIRTVRLRDTDGYVHTIPFGEISVLTNMMRDFGYAVLDVGVAYKENTDEVIEAIREVDREARQDEAFTERLAGDLEVFGVNALDNSGVTIRCRVRTLAGYQWGVRREYLRRIKMKFDEVGIEIGFPHMTVWFGEMTGGKGPPVAHVRIDTDAVPSTPALSPLEEMGGS
jgi:small conductance mechanosensitive channel